MVVQFSLIVGNKPVEVIELAHAHLRQQLEVVHENQIENLHSVRALEKRIMLTVFRSDISLSS